MCESQRAGERLHHSSPCFHWSMASSTRRGDACYFPRNLVTGTYGGDVHCLQQYLNHKGYLPDEPDGFYGDRTSDAARRWQEAIGLEGGGVLDIKARAAYAKLLGLPTPGSNRVTNEDGDEKGVRNNTNKAATCIDVCAAWTGSQDCSTRCARHETDKKHACRQACQVAFSAACDRAFPPGLQGGDVNYKICLQYQSTSCDQTCVQFE